jgi:hypothetical protein
MKTRHTRRSRQRYPRNRRLGAARLTVPASIAIAGIFCFLFAFLLVSTGCQKKSENGVQNPPAETGKTAP